MTISATEKVLKIPTGNLDSRVEPHKCSKMEHLFSRRHETGLMVVANDHYIRRLVNFRPANWRNARDDARSNFPVGSLIRAARAQCHRHTQAVSDR